MALTQSDIELHSVTSGLGLLLSKNVWLIDFIIQKGNDLKSAFVHACQKGSLLKQDVTNRLYVKGKGNCSDR